MFSKIFSCFFYFSRLLSLALLSCLMCSSVFASPQTGKGYELKDLGSGVYFLSDGSYNTMFVVSDQGVIVVDPLPSLGHKYQEAIAEVTSQTVTHIIYSHEHLDHIGAAYLFPADAKIIAHENTRILLDEAHDPRRPVPDISFRKTYHLHVGNQSLELQFSSENHTAGNIFIYLPRQKILMLVDVIYPAYAPYPNLGVATNIGGLIVVNKKALDYDFKEFVGGHVGQPGSRKDVETSLIFLEDLEKTARQVLSEKTFTHYLKSRSETDTKSTWFAHDDYENDRVAACYAQLLPVWDKRLLGLHRSLKSHCWTMIMSLAISLPSAPNSSP
ncbi:MBL fold metallo-hydrolase [Undibacterium sp. JH2W]|uniref:MBL fold metallo-hydrolase n=1 Tax=Undibacterium sp. JH2W TaxID=3413037 RepID=UPI003BF286B5